MSNQTLSSAAQAATASTVNASVSSANVAQTAANTAQLPKKASRNFSLDCLRAFACFLVINQHCAEQFYGVTGHVEVGDDTFYTGFEIFLGRVCVPLFVMLSGYFLLPMKGTTTDFFKKRLTRIVWPFLIWSALYSVFYVFYAGYTPWQAVKCFLNLFIVSTPECYHMWFIYMLVGLYLLTPVITPWLQRASKRQLQFYLALWLISTLLPFLNRYVSKEMWGLSFWNPSPLFYYFTGFAGYFILGYYIKRFGALKIAPSIIFVIFGYVVAAIFFSHDMFHYYDYADLEMSTNFCSLNIVLMTWGVFSLFTYIKWQGHNRLGRLITDFSEKSYGIYLAHIIVVLSLHRLLVSIYPELFALVTGPGYTYHRIWGNFPACLAAIPVHAVLTTVVVYLLIKVLSLLPNSHKLLGA